MPIADKLSNNTEPNVARFRTIRRISGKRAYRTADTSLQVAAANERKHQREDRIDQAG